MEPSHRLCLCPSDLNRANFMKLEGYRIVALDFGSYSFLSPSFFAFAPRYGGSSTYAWRWHIAKVLSYPPSTEVEAMVSGSSCPLFLCLPPFLLQEYHVQCAAQVSRRSSDPGFISKRSTQAVPRITRLSPSLSSPICTLLRFAYFRRFLPNVSTSYSSYVSSFPRVETQLHGRDLYPS